MPRRRHFFDLEREHDHYLNDLAEEARANAEYEAWLARQPVPGPHYPYADVPDDLPIARLEGYDERDPYDRLKSEGGHLSE